MEDEERLLQRVKDADREAFHALFTKYQPILFKTVYYKVNDYGLTQDIVQDTFLKVWLKRETLKPKLAFFSFIVKISHNLIQDHYKHLHVRSKHRDHVKFISERPPDNPEKALRQSVLESKIREVAHNSLATKCRTVFLLSRVAGIPNQEIADMLGITKKTVENQLHHALKVIRKKCKDYL